jgi:hypothetical protein
MNEVSEKTDVSVSDRLLNDLVAAVREAVRRQERGRGSTA